MNLVIAPEGGYCARASNFSVRPSVLSVLSCLSLKMSSKFPSFGSAKKAPLNPKRIENR